MDDLSHWDFAEKFTALEAAVLIIGIDPTIQNLDSWEKYPKCKPIFEKLLSSYQKSWGYWHVHIDGLPESNYHNVSMPIDAIESVGMNEFQGQGFDVWIGHGTCQDGEFSAFGKQKFSRSEIARWLSAIGMKSVYQFDRSQPQAVETPSGRWPWGNHHTELLGHLEAAAKRYWVNYNPDDATTAPTNKDVAEWLVNERNVSQKMAESIASILRPDGLPTGPRK